MQVHSPFHAACCNVLQCASTGLSMQRVAISCNVRQCIASCCNMLQYVAICCNMLQYVAICCNMLQHVAICCDMLQYAATCYSVLQCMRPVGLEAFWCSFREGKNKENLPIESSLPSMSLSNTSIVSMLGLRALATCLCVCVRERE